MVMNTPVAKRNANAAAVAAQGRNGPLPPLAAVFAGVAASRVARLVKGGAMRIGSFTARSSASRISDDKSASEVNLASISAAWAALAGRIDGSRARKLPTNPTNAKGASGRSVARLGGSVVANNRSFASGDKSGVAANGARPHRSLNNVAPSEYKSAR